MQRVAHERPPHNLDKLTARAAVTSCMNHCRLHAIETYDPLIKSRLPHASYGQAQWLRGLSLSRKDTCYSGVITVWACYAKLLILLAPRRGFEPLFPA